MADHYETLGVPRTATCDQVRQAYRRRRGKVHPDRMNGDATAMAELNRAYETLVSPQRRLNYDQTGRDILSDLERMARDWIVREACAWLGDANTTGDMVGALKYKLAIELGNMRNADFVQGQVIERFNTKLRRLKSRDKDWLRPLLETQILAAQHQRGKGAEQMIVLNRAMELLGSYEFG